MWVGQQRRHVCRRQWPGRIWGRGLEAIGSGDKGSLLRLEKWPVEKSAEDSNTMGGNLQYLWWTEKSNGVVFSVCPFFKLWVVNICSFLRLNFWVFHSWLWYLSHFHFSLLPCLPTSWSSSSLLFYTYTYMYKHTEPTEFFQCCSYVHVLRGWPLG